MPEIINGPWGEVLAIIVRSDFEPASTTFVTPPEYTQQVGFIVYEADGEVKPHVHADLERRIIGTSEVVFVKRGSCVLDVYTQDGEPVCSRQLAQGDLVLTVGGGHGYRMLEDTLLVEVKQGPYAGADERRNI
jgi:hypothetical protein